MYHCDSRNPELVVCKKAIRAEQTDAKGRPEWLLPIHVFIVLPQVRDLYVMALTNMLESATGMWEYSGIVGRSAMESQYE